MREPHRNLYARREAASAPPRAVENGGFARTGRGKIVERKSASAMSHSLFKAASDWEREQSGPMTASRIGTDTISLVAFTAFAYIFAVEYDAFERLYEFCRAHEDWELDEIFTAGAVLGFGGVVFAVRRILDLRSEIADRAKAERELIAYRDSLEQRVDEATRELKAKAADTERALAKEKKVTELQRQFVAMASHELRTPLAIIDATAQRLAMRAGRLSPAELTDRSGEIRTAVRRMIHLIDETLTSARMEAGEHSIDVGPCDIAELVSEVCETHRALAEDHAISCHIADLPDTIEADSEAIRQVLSNLLCNAVKYSPGSPQIWLTATADPDTVHISVRDQGLGIDTEDVPHVFGRFFRAKTSTGIAGTGLGLNLARKLVEMHGGAIEVESRVREGTTFTVRLPVQGPTETAETENEAA